MSDEIIGKQAEPNETKVARVEGLLREAIERRKAEGVEIVAENWLDFDERGVSRCCAVAAVFPVDRARAALDDRHGLAELHDRFVALGAEVLGIGESDVGAIARGFDDSPSLDYEDPAFFALGQRLREAFILEDEDDDWDEDEAEEEDEPIPDEEEPLW